MTAPIGAVPGITAFDRSISGHRASSFPAPDVPDIDPTMELPSRFLRTDAPLLPELSEVELVRHYTNLSRMNFGVDVGFYPLGSCTMKYNPKVNEEVAALSGFTSVHPRVGDDHAQGLLRLLYDLSHYLLEIVGLDDVALSPAAGAHGELLGLMLMRAYHRDRDDHGRRLILIPDSAHGTNPASVGMAGFEVRTVRSGADGCLDVDALASMLGPDVAGLMLTNPNTLGVFEKDIVSINRLVHEAGGLTYCDGANLNALLGRSRPGDVGFDVLHINVHKTFSTPHGGGGPGGGPVAVRHILTPYLPVPRIVEEEGRYRLETSSPKSIGRIRSFIGNVGVLVKAYAYIRALGAPGLARATDAAVLNANYVLERIKGAYPPATAGRPLHEFVVSAADLKRTHGIRAMDVAKGLLDQGFHAPTVYFPLIVEEALMIEPTETESIPTLDVFADAMIEITETAARAPTLLMDAPSKTPVSRLDDATAARNLDVVWRPESSASS